MCKTGFICNSLLPALLNLCFVFTHGMWMRLQVSYSNCVVGWTSEELVLFPDRSKGYFFFSEASGPALGLVQAILWALSQRIK